MHCPVALAATGLGLGTVSRSVSLMQTSAHPPLIESLALPEDHTIRAACLLGYPSETFLRIPVRKPSMRPGTRRPLYDKVGMSARTLQ